MRSIALPFSVSSFFVAVLSALAACSGGETSVAAPAAPVDGGPEPAEDAPASRTDAEPPSHPSDAAAHDAAGDERIDPIELGYSWTYDVMILGVYPLCKAGSNVGQVLGQKEVSGKQAFQLQSFCPGAGTSSYAVDGDRVEVFYGGAWILALDAPVQEGHSWSNGAATFTWEKSPAVTTPAGTFDNCWTARQTNSANYTVFCRGVGPVHWHYLDGANGYDAVLTKKSF